MKALNIIGALCLTLVLAVLAVAIWGAVVQWHVDAHRCQDIGGTWRLPGVCEWPR